MCDRGGGDRGGGLSLSTTWSQIYHSAGGVLALSAFLVSNVREGSEAVYANFTKLSKMHPL